MAGDDYYGDLDAGRDFPRNDNWATKNTMKIHESISHQDLPPHKSSSGDVHEGTPTAKSLVDEGKAVKRHRYDSLDELQEKFLGNESKVTESTGQRPGDYSFVAAADVNGAKASATTSTSVKEAEVQGHGQSQGHGSAQEFHGKFFFAQTVCQFLSKCFYDCWHSYVFIDVWIYVIRHAILPLARLLV